MGCSPLLSSTTPSSTPSVGRIPEGTEQEWNVVMCLRFGDLEDDRNAGVKRPGLALSEIGPGLERDPVDARCDGFVLWQERFDSSVTVRLAAGQFTPLFP